MQNNLTQALDTLKTGGLILYPTDTVWGIGCDATNEKAVEKLLNLKQRSNKNGLITLLFNDNNLFDYVKEVPDIAFELIDASVRPLTIIYPNAKNLAPKVIANDGSIAIRICKNSSCAELLKRFRKPIVSTSANLSNQKHPANFEEINSIITKNVDSVYYPDFSGSSDKPSQIIKLYTDGTFKVIRK